MSEARLPLSLFVASLALLGCTSEPEPPKAPPPSAEACKEPRPEMCMEIYMPACGYTESGVGHTYPNSCHACTHAEVVAVTPGACKTDKPLPHPNTG